LLRPYIIGPGRGTEHRGGVVKKGSGRRICQREDKVGRNGKKEKFKEKLNGFRGRREGGRKCGKEGKACMFAVQWTRDKWETTERDEHGGRG